MRELTHFINGEHVKGTSGRFADVYNPATGEVQARVPLASPAELDAAVAVAVRNRPMRVNRKAMTTVANTSKNPSTQRCTTHQRQYSAIA